MDADADPMSDSPARLTAQVWTVAAKQLDRFKPRPTAEDEALSPRWREARWEQIPNRFRWATVGDLTEPEARDIRAWAEATGPLPNLVLYGPTGTGKTHAAVAAARLRFDAGDEVQFWPVVELLDGLRPGGDLEVWDRAVTDADTLILDDLGASRATDWTDERLYALINRRWLDERPTIVTTNLAPEDLMTAVGERIASRVLGCGAVVLGVGGPDRRLDP